MSSTDDFDFSNWDDENDEPQEKPKTGPAELRKAYKALQEQLKEVRAQNAKLLTASRKPELVKLLTSKGVEENRASALVKLVPDSVQATDADVDSWLADNADALGIQLGAGSDTAVPEEDRTAITRQQAALDSRPPAVTRSFEAIRQQMEAIKKTGDHRALAAFYDEIGAPPAPMGTLG